VPQCSSGRVSEWVPIRAAILLSLFTLLTSLFATAAQWRGIYDDAPIAVRITPNKKVFHVGDTFRLAISATNTSDRDLLIKRDWKEQLVFYHLLPSSRAPRPARRIPGPRSLDSGPQSTVPGPESLEAPLQVEWPGRALIATWIDSTDVVRLRPGESYTVNRDVRVWIPDDVATFQFRLKLVGVKDYGRKFDMWQGIAWSNAITLTVKPKP
jgi:hypothetical protein